MPYKDAARQRSYQREYVAERRAQALMGKRCVDCGATEHLEFDHVDPTQKVSHRIWSWSVNRIAAELAKCVVRCRSCHHARHGAERRSHGIGGYQKRGCRCEVCCEAKAASNRRYHERRGRKSNPGLGLCRPAHSHSATAPSAPPEPIQMALWEAAA